MCTFKYKSKSRQSCLRITIIFAIRIKIKKEIFLCYFMLQDLETNEMIYVCLLREKKNSVCHKSLDFRHFTNMWLHFSIIFLCTFKHFISILYILKALLYRLINARRLHCFKCKRHKKIHIINKTVFFE